MKNKLVIIISMLLLTACGFTPVHKVADGQSAANLAAVKVQANDNLMGQFYTTKLSDLLDPTSKGLEAKYRLEAKLNKNKIPFAIQQDRTITRYKITVDAEYKLVDIATGDVIDEGRLRREGGYDKVESDYATYISDEDTTKRIVKELAEDTRIRVMASLVAGG